MEKELGSERVILSSPMSFSGSAARIWRITQTKNEWLHWLLLIPLALTLVFFAWCIILCWYCLFGILLVPWRLFRRGQRKEKRDALQHKELLAQLEKTQANKQN
jgi:hypothetical protein